jgi:hypothetical protein
MNCVWRIFEPIQQNLKRREAEWMQQTYRARLKWLLALTLINPGISRLSSHMTDSLAWRVKDSKMWATFQKTTRYLRLFAWLWSNRKLQYIGFCFMRPDAQRLPSAIMPKIIWLFSPTRLLLGG